MCDICSGAKTPDQIRKEMFDTILEHGHQIIAIYGGEGPPFAYSVGRTLRSLPELIVVGDLPPVVMSFMINEADRLQAEGLPVEDGYEFASDTLLAGYPVRVVAVDPELSEMHQAIQACGDGVVALQLVWPDRQGRFPGEGFDTSFRQTVFKIEGT